jgi:hypothetical protein
MDVTLNPVPLHNSSNKIVDRDNNIGDVTHFSVTDDRPSRPRQASRRAPEPVTVQFQIIDEHGNVVTLDWDEDDPDHAPFAAAAGATKSPKLERRAAQ